MDALREKATTTIFKRISFSRWFNAKRQVVTFKPDEGLSSRTSECSNTDTAEQWLAGSGPGPDDQAAILDVMALEQTANMVITATPKLFESIFEQFEMDPYFIYLIARNVDGFFKMPPLPDHSGGQTLSYFLHVKGQYMLMWTYFVDTETTKAICITRPSLFGPGLFGQLRDGIDSHLSLLRHPLALAAICSAELADSVSREIEPELKAIVEVESKTGFNPFEGASLRSVPLGFGAPQADNLNIPSGMMSNTSVVLALHTKHLGFILAVLEDLTLPRLLDKAARDVIPAAHWPGYESLSHKIAELAAVLAAECVMTKPYIHLLKERVVAQQAALGNMIAQQQYVATIQLAKDSRTIALATKNDSSSMKGLALVTMAFLPATFFATLFAVPLLKWDESPVVQTRFWVYLAFTIPITATILVCWVVYSVLRGRKVESLNQKERKRVATGDGLDPLGYTASGVEREPTIGSWEVVVPMSRRKNRLAQALARVPAEVPGP